MCANFQFYTTFRKKSTAPKIHGVFAQLGFFIRGGQTGKGQKWSECVSLYSIDQFSALTFHIGVFLTHFRLCSTCLFSGLDIQGQDGRRKRKICIQVVNDLYCVCAKFHQNRTTFKVKGLARIKLVTPKKFFLSVHLQEDFFNVIFPRSCNVTNWLN